MDVFDKSLEDMKWKMLECYEIHGVYGNFVGHWYDGFFNLTRFGLGRLQFELRPFEGKEDCEVEWCTDSSGRYRDQYAYSIRRADETGTSR